MDFGWDTEEITQSGRILMRRVSGMFLGQEAVSTPENPHVCFGVDLEKVMKFHDPTEDTDKIGLPAVILRAGIEIEKRGLQEEGVFRISGMKTHVEKLQEQFDRGKCPDLSNEEIPDLASLFKLFFRLLPEPLLTFRLFEEFNNACAGIDPGGEVAREAVRAAMKQLPAHNYMLLHYLGYLLAQVTNNVAANKMSSTNLAIVFGPAILSSGGGELEFNNGDRVIKCVISHYSALFGPDRPNYPECPVPEPPLTPEQQKEIIQNVKKEVKQKIMDEDEMIAQQQEEWRKKEQEEKKKLKKELKEKKLQEEAIRQQEEEKKREEEKRIRKELKQKKLEEKLKKKEEKERKKREKEAAMIEDEIAPRVAPTPVKRVASSTFSTPASSASSSASSLTGSLSDSSASAISTASNTKQAPGSLPNKQTQKFDDTGGARIIEVHALETDTLLGASSKKENCCSSCLIM